MTSTQDYIEYVCDQIAGTGEIRYRKMFGDYMVYVNDKPVLLICDDTVYVKILDETKDILANAEIGTPYDGAKPHYILDIDNRELSTKIINILEPITPVPKSKRKK
jgi:TfoX/Sxy family transcriptional regulator of competence genes